VFPFNLYDLFVMSFVQLLLSTALVLSPARNLDTKLRWTGSRVTEILVGTVAATAVAAAASVVTVEVWGLGARPVETAGLLLVLASVVVMALRPDCRVVGQIFYASYASAGLAFLAFAIRVAAGSTHSILEGLTASLWLFLGFSAFVVWTSNVNYVSDVLCRARRSRPLPEVDPDYRPMVSLHLAAYNEPPELFIETIKAVERIDYPNFEVVVVDNNTMDPAVWKPIEEYCRDRPRLKFVHVAPWPGFKAGACNLALRQYTDPKAEIIGIVDADDIVQPHYLKETAPYFCDPKVGFVQSFEGNRDYHGSSYYQACVDSYQGFYVAIMSSRNERDSVPFVGTMGLFRRSALEGVGGWNEWCISEDTEASLRVLKAGWSGFYLPRCFGRGIVRGVEHAALPVVFRRYADLPAPLAKPDAMGPLSRQPPVPQPAPRLPHGLLGLVEGPYHGRVFATALGGHRAVGIRFGLRPDAARRRPVFATDVAHHRRRDLHDGHARSLDGYVLPAMFVEPRSQPVRVLGNRGRLRYRSDAEGRGLPPDLEINFP
jgi:hypothetical protein